MSENVFKYINNDVLWVILQMTIENYAGTNGLDLDFEKSLLGKCCHPHSASMQAYCFNVMMNRISVCKRFNRILKSKCIFWNTGRHGFDTGARWDFAPNIKFKAQRRRELYQTRTLPKKLKNK
jgi:hypothetical protein